jgi:hypothetical protein
MSVVIKPAAMKDRMKKVESTEMRDLKSENEQLRKELDRKNSRSDAQTAELQSLRQNMANLQRELKAMSSLLEKSTGDRQILIHGSTKMKDYIERLEKQNFRLSDSLELTSTIDRQQDRINDLENELTTAASIITARDERIKVLERELEIIQRAIESQIHYSEGMNSTQQGREMLKALYYELGKRKVDVQSLAASLSAASQETEYFQNQLKDATVQKSQLEGMYNTVTAKFNQLVTKSREDENEIQGLHAELARNVEIVTVAHAHCEDVSKQLEETRSKARDAAAESARTINSLTADLNAATKEAHGLKQQVAALQQEVAHSTNMNALLDRKSKDEVAKLSDQRDELYIAANRAKELDIELEGVRRQLREMTIARDDLQLRMQGLRHQLEQESSAFLAELGRAENKGHGLEHSLREEREALRLEREKVRQLQQEKEYAIESCRVAVAGSKDLGMKIRELQAEKESLEQQLGELAVRHRETVADLQHSRASISNAVMDALTVERERVALLERENQLLAERESARHRQYQQQSQLHSNRTQMQSEMHSAANRAPYMGDDNDDAIPHLKYTENYPQSSRQNSRLQHDGEETSESLFALAIGHVHDYEQDNHHPHHQYHDGSDRIFHQRRHEERSSGLVNDDHHHHNHHSHFLLGPQLISSVDVQDTADLDHSVHHHDYNISADSLGGLGIGVGVGVGGAGGASPEPVYRHVPAPAPVPQSQYQNAQKTGAIPRDADFNNHSGAPDTSSYLPKEVHRRETTDGLSSSNLEFSVAGSVNQLPTSTTTKHVISNAGSNPGPSKSVNSSFDSFRSVSTASSATGGGNKPTATYSMTTHSWSFQPQQQSTDSGDQKPKTTMMSELKRYSNFVTHSYHRHAY